MATALSIVQQVFPNVTTVKDANKDTRIEVTKRDTASATVRNHKACAMAVACKRKMDLDGVIMSVSTAYLVKGTTATRYLVPTSVAREIVAFDRNAVFEPGDYQLKAPGESSRIGKAQSVKLTTGRKDGKLAKRFRHKTGDIRTSLGSKSLV